MENTLNATCTKPNNRIPYLDLLKFIAMTFICFGHVLQRYYVVGFTQTIGFAILYSVELGIFFFVGGYLAKKPKKLKILLLYILKMFITYLIPAFLFTCLSIWFLPRFEGNNFAYWMNQLFYYTDTFYWYFLVAFLLNVGIAASYYFSQLIFKKEGLKYDIMRSVIILVLMGLYSLIFIYIYNSPTLGPKCLSSDLTLYYISIVFIGSMFSTFHKYFENIKSRHLIRGAIFLVCLAGYITSLYYFSNWFTVLDTPFKDISTHMLGSLAGTICYVYLAFYLSKLTFVSKVSVLGKYSGPFYLVHVFFIRLLYSFSSRPIDMVPSAILYVMIFMIIFYFGSLVVTIILVKIPYTDIILFMNYKRFKQALFIKEKS
ncbi:MAG: acyltransferase family protein [Bacillales bacterium]|nr:acyltransferase family protein [Bacillales bacterium]